jgi:hypothetical protein
VRRCFSVIVHQAWRIRSIEQDSSRGVWKKENE